MSISSHSIPNQSGPSAGQPPIIQPPSEEEQIEQLVRRLRQIVKVGAGEIRVVRWPLRISPLGAHIDHQLGVVTGMTIDRSVLLAFVPTADGSVHLESLNFPSAT